MKSVGLAVVIALAASVASAHEQTVTVCYDHPVQDSSANYNFNTQQWTFCRTEQKEHIHIEEAKEIIPFLFFWTLLNNQNNQ